MTVATYKTSITGTTPFADYTFRVRGVNQQGTGEWSSETAPVQFNFNEATGGTETIVDNYNGSGERWRVHTFTGNGTLDVSLSVQPFRLLVGAGGGGGDAGADSWYGRGGGAGEVLQDYAWQPAVGSYSASIGNGGGGGGYGAYSSSAGQPTTFAGLTARAGGGTTPSRAGNSGNGTPGGASGQYGGGSGGGIAGSGSSGITFDITGQALVYGQGGTNGGYPTVPARANSSDGGKSVSNGSVPSGPLAGSAGVVIVAYRIG